MKDFEMQTFHVVVDNHDGAKVEVGPFSENSEWVGIRMISSDGACEAEMAFPKEQAALVAEALAKAASGKPHGAPEPDKQKDGR